MAPRIAQQIRQSFTKFIVTCTRYTKETIWWLWCNVTIIKWHSEINERLKLGDEMCQKSLSETSNKDVIMKVSVH